MKLADYFLESIPYFYAWVEKNEIFSFYRFLNKNELEPFIPKPQKIRPHLIPTVALINDSNGLYFPVKENRSDFGYFKPWDFSCFFNWGGTVLHAGRDYVHLSNGNYIIFGADYNPEIIDAILHEIKFCNLVRQAFWQEAWSTASESSPNENNRHFINHLSTPELLQQFGAKELIFEQNFSQQRLRIRTRDNSDNIIESLPYNIIKSWLQPGFELEELEDGWFKIIEI